MLVAMRSINSVKRMDNAVTESLTYQAMKASPACDPARTLDCEHITDVFKQQRKTGYQDDQPPLAELDADTQRPRMMCRLASARYMPRLPPPYT